MKVSSVSHCLVWWIHTPVWHHCSLSNDFRVLLRDLDRCGAGHEVKVQDTTRQVVLQVLTVCVIDLKVHAIGVEEEDTVGAILAAVIEVNWVGAVEVGVCRGAVGVTVPGGARVVGGVQHARGVG